MIKSKKLSKVIIILSVITLTSCSIIKKPVTFVKSFSKAKKEIKALKPVIIDMDKSITNICNLIIADIGDIPNNDKKGYGLRNKYWTDYQNIINYIYILSGKNKNLPFSQKEYQINLLIDSINNQKYTESTLKEAQGAIKHIKTIHNKIYQTPISSSKKDIHNINALIYELEQKNKNIKKYLKTLDV